MRAQIVPFPDIDISCSPETIFHCSVSFEQSSLKYVLTAVDAEAFAQIILICYFNVSVCFYANHVSVHAKDLRRRGELGLRIMRSMIETPQQTRARGDARICACVRTYVRRAYALLLWQLNCTMMLRTIATKDITVEE